MKIARALGQIINRLRINRNIAQESFTLEARVDRTRLEEIERGEADPSMDTLARIASVLGRSLSSLVIEAEVISEGDVTDKDN